MAVLTDRIVLNTAQGPRRWVQIQKATVVSERTSYKGVKKEGLYMGSLRNTGKPNWAFRSSTFQASHITFSLLILIGPGKNKHGEAMVLQNTIVQNYSSVNDIKILLEIVISMFP